MKHKKAQINQVVYFGVLILSIAICLLIGKIVLDKFNNALEEGNMHTTESRQALIDWNVIFPTFDTAIIVVLVFLAIGLMITSFMIPTHPIFMVINIFGIFFLVFMGAVMSNLYHDIIVSEPDLIAAADSFPKINYVINYMPYILAILIFITTIIMYSRTQSQGGW